MSNVIPEVERQKAQRSGRSTVKDYETEVRLARDAIASTNKKLVTAQSASSISRDAEETAKDSDIIKWYEDLTNLVVLSVKVIPGDCGREVTFVCVETLADHSRYRITQVISWYAVNMLTVFSVLACRSKLPSKMLYNSERGSLETRQLDIHQTGRLHADRLGS